MELPEVQVNIFAPTRPHKGQQVVLNALDSGIRFVLLRAGRKFRKTSMMVSWLFEKAFETGLVCPYIAPNRIQAKNIAWDDHVSRILNELNAKNIPYKKNEVELSIKLPNGGKVQLLGVENKEALRGISNWGAVAGDEIDDWGEDIWPTIIRPNLMVHKSPAILGGTPKGYRHMYKLENGGIFKPFHFSSYENPDLDPKELEDMVSEYKAMGEAYYRQEIMAEYEKPVGTVYSEWNMQTRYVPFAYDPNLPVHLSWDFGVNDPTSILFIQPNGHEIRIFDYYEAGNANIEHFAQVISAKGYKVPALETGDIAGRAKDLTSGKSPIQELARLGHHIRTQSIPDVPTQIRHAHKYIPRLYVSSSNPNCERVRDCLINYRYPEKNSNIINQSNEVPIHDEYSHAMRAFEYYCWNLLEQTTRLPDYVPSNSIAGILKKKEEDRWLNKEYVGY